MSFVLVRVWVSLIKARSPGHASLAIHPHARTAEQGYVSFAPLKSGSIHGPGKFYSFEHDLKHYQRRGLWIGTIYGLDIDKMFAHFLAAQAHPQVYSPANECATQVHRYLKIGGGDEYASLWSRHAFACWSPDDVEDYARSIVKGTAKLGSRGVKIKGEGTVF